MGRQSGPNLPCDENCALIERNRRLAEALEISLEPVPVVPGESTLIPSVDDALCDGYNHVLLQYACRNLIFVKSIENVGFSFLCQIFLCTH
jgi:hypothetical protein